MIILVATLIDRGIAIGGTLLLNMQGHTTTANDSTLIKLFSGVSPVLVVLLLGIAAPIMEEIVFRGGIIGYLVENNALLAILISSFYLGLFMALQILSALECISSWGLSFQFLTTKQKT